MLFEYDIFLLPGILELLLAFFQDPRHVVILLLFQARVELFKFLVQLQCRIAPHLLRLIHSHGVHLHGPHRVIDQWTCAADGVDFFVAALDVDDVVAVERQDVVGGLLLLGSCAGLVDGVFGQVVGDMAVVQDVLLEGFQLFLLEFFQVHLVLNLLLPDFDKVVFLFLGRIPLFLELLFHFFQLLQTRCPIERVGLGVTVRYLGASGVLVLDFAR